MIKKLSFFYVFYSFVCVFFFVLLVLRWQKSEAPLFQRLIAPAVAAVRGNSAC